MLRNANVVEFLSGLGCLGGVGIAALLWSQHWSLSIAALAVSFAVIGRLSPDTSCDVCSNQLRSGTFKKEIDGRRVVVCSQCHAKLQPKVEGARKLKADQKPRPAESAQAQL